MRPELFFRPSLLLERVTARGVRRRRLRRLRGTCAGTLSDGHIESLELLELLQSEGVETIYDVGANVGTWTLLAKAMFPEAVVHAFEPLPLHASQFTRNAKAFANVHLHEVGLGSENKTVPLRVANYSDASSVLSFSATEDNGGLSEVQQVPITLRRLDEFRVEYSLTGPDLLKLDVQGYELEVLKGATQCLAAAKAVITEVSFVPYYQRQCLFHDVVAFLAEFGLHLTALGVSTHLGRRLTQADALFTRATPT